MNKRLVQWFSVIVTSCISSDSGESPAKKKPHYELSKELKEWISEDEANKKIWDELLQGAANNNSVCVVPYVVKF